MVGEDADGGGHVRFGLCRQLLVFLERHHELCHPRDHCGAVTEPGAEIQAHLTRREIERAAIAERSRATNKQ